MVFADVKLQRCRPGEIADANREIRRLHRNVARGSPPTVRGNSVRAAAVAFNLTFHLKFHFVHASGLRERVVAEREIPSAAGRESFKALKRAGAIGRYHEASKVVIISAIIREPRYFGIAIKQLIRAGRGGQRRANDGSVIIQYRRLTVVIQRPDEIAEAFMCDIVRDEDAAHGFCIAARIERRARQGEPARSAGLAGTAVRNLVAIDRIRLHKTVRVFRSQRQQAEDAEEVKLRGHLILSFHADVIDVVLRRVGEDEELVTAQVISGLRFERGRDDCGVKKCDRRIRRDIHVNVRTQPRGIIRVLGEHPDARRADVGLECDKERGVGERSRVGHHEEMPLVRAAVGADEHRGIRAQALVLQEAGGERSLRCIIRHTRDMRLVRGHDRQISADHRDRVDDLTVAGSDHQRVVLHDLVGVGGDGVHVHAASDDGDGVIRAERRRDVGVLDVVDGIQIGRRVGVPRERERAAGDVVAVIDIACVAIGDDEIEIVDELHTRNRIARRIRPRQRDA